MYRIHLGEKMAGGRIGSWFLRFAGHLVPLVQSVPVWTGLMTFPFAGYLALIFANVSENLPVAWSMLFTLEPFLVAERVLVIVGFLILVFSIIYLLAKRTEGLVTSGPYRLVRHPQYLGMILSTLGFTSWSVWILSNTRGIGFLDQSQTVMVWFAELLAYVVLAYFEELSLSRKYGESFRPYKGRVAFFIPFVKTKRERLDIIVSVSILAILLFGLMRIRFYTWI